jgi:formylglycine-generating enzyme required for sulfatase activity
LNSILPRLVILALLCGCASSDLTPAHPKHTKKKDSQPVLPAENPQPVLGSPQPLFEKKPVLGESPVTGKESVAPQPILVKQSVTELKKAPALRKGPLEPPTRLNRRDGSTLVSIPGGKYLVPLNPPSHHRMTDNSRGLQVKILPEFYIDLTEVTVEQFKKFDPDYDETVFNGGKECPQCPAMGIDWRRARNYCRWADKRLPTEEEWEAAARGPTQRLVPWEGETSHKRANLLGDADGYTGPAPVGSFPTGASPTGVLDMVGNVWEWVATPVPTGSSPQPASTMESPSNPEHSRSSQTSTPTNQAYLLKGGSWSSPELLAAISIRNPVSGSAVNPTFGFRCAQSAH